MIELRLTEDGSHTLFVPEMNEHYHSIHGAIQESMHIFITQGFDTCESNEINILEIGLGTGLNVFLTALRQKGSCKYVNYTAIEKYPVSKEFAEKLNYHNLIPEARQDLFRLIHTSPWNCEVEISKSFTLRKIERDATTFIPEGSYNLIYFDAFGPDKQPEMWTPDVFSKIAEYTQPGGILVTYSAKGHVKRTLRDCGFNVKLMPGPPGKRHIIRALKN